MPAELPLPRTSREIRLAVTPDGLPEATHFALVETPIPQPGPGEVLVRNHHFVLFAGLRTLMGTENDGVPLPRCAAVTRSSDPPWARSSPRRTAARCARVTP